MKNSPSSKLVVRDKNFCHRLLARFTFNMLYTCTAFSDVTQDPQSHLEIAIQAAQDYCSSTAFKIVSDKFQFLTEMSSQPSCEDTFHVVDIGMLADRYTLWHQYLPQVTPHYAVKTNNDAVISAVLAGLGTNFDCASQNEIEQILMLGVSPSRIIFAHPRKSPASIVYAKKMGVDLLTFDSIEEMEKIAALHPEANLILRIKTDDSHSAIPLSQKFGATLEEAYEILAAGFSQKARIIGITFHVGSNCKHVNSYRMAILDAAELFQHSKNHWNRELSILDLGGGWPGTDDDSFISIAQMVAKLIQIHFPLNTRIIAEPGRYFAARTTTLATKILGKKHLKQTNKKAYYLANGVYGFFNSSLYYEFNSEKILSEGWLINPLRPNGNSRFPSLLWGPTCDSGDKIIDGITLPEMETGDYITVENLGAYSKSMETFFNGIPLSKPYYICEQK